MDPGAINAIVRLYQGDIKAVLRVDQISASSGGSRRWAKEARCWLIPPISAASGTNPSRATDHSTCVVYEERMSIRSQNMSGLGACVCVCVCVRACVYVYRASDHRPARVESCIYIDI